MKDIQAMQGQGIQGCVDTAALLELNNQAAEVYQSDRRSFMKHGLCMTAALGFWMPSMAEATPVINSGRELRLHNAHTGEKFRGEYWYDGKYNPDAFRDIKRIMRDFRTGEVFPIDPRLMDILFVLNHRMGNKGAFEVYSGYRSPKTNAKLRRMTKGVARRSLHMQGQAIDTDLPGVRLSYLRKAALSLRAGGVGYYPSSDFLHFDTGRVRSW